MARVRTYYRTTASGKRAKVNQHTRRSGPNPGHAWTMTKRGVGHHKRGRKGLAAVCIGLGGIEVLLWFVLNTTGFLASLVGAILLALGYILITHK